MEWIDGDTVWTAEFEPERLLATADLYSATNQETEYIAYPVGLDLKVQTPAVVDLVSPILDQTVR